MPSRVVAPDSKGTFINKNIIYGMINEYRAENNVSPMQESSLCEYAKERSEEIVTDWSHDQWVEDGINNVKRYSLVCPECENMGENLGKEAFYNEELLLAWKNSPLHNKALLDPKYDIMCVETTWDGDISYTALEFGDIDGK